MKKHVSETPATAMLRRAGIDFDEHQYDYVENGGTRVAAQAIDVDEHQLIKTLVMHDEHARVLIVLMHGDCRVSTKNLARSIHRKSVAACDAPVAMRHTGYQIGGTSPFGLRRRLPVYVEATVLGLDRIWINGGRRGYLLGMHPSVLSTFLGAQPVSCALEEK